MVLWEALMGVVMCKCTDVDCSSLLLMAGLLAGVSLEHATARVYSLKFLGYRG